MNRERIEYYAHLTVTALGVGIAAFLFFRYLFVAVLPFLISWAAAFVLRPAARRISEKTRIPIKIVSVMLTILCVLVGLGLVGLFSFFVIKEAGEFFSSIAGDKRVIDILSKITNPLGAFLGDADSLGALTEHIGSAIEEGMRGLVSKLVSLLSDIAASIPRVLFFILVTVISSVYFALDIERVNAWIKGLLPKKWSGALSRLKESFISVGAKYVRSYLILMSITFFVMLTGLLILKTKNAILLSVIIAILDLLPIIGVGTVIIPWSIVELLLGNTGVGIGLIVLLAVHELVRQIAEPKIIGKNLGVHPIVSIILLYVGYCVLGFAGILLVPVLAIVLKIAFDGVERDEKS